MRPYIPCSACWPHFQYANPKYQSKNICFPWASLSISGYLHTSPNTFSLLPFSPLTPYLLIILQTCVPLLNQKRKICWYITRFHFTLLEADDIHKHSVTIVQTTHIVTTCYNKLRYSKVGCLYFKYANLSDRKNSINCYGKKKINK
jgi:hypothetical protein